MAKSSTKNTQSNILSRILKPIINPIINPTITVKKDPDGSIFDRKFTGLGKFMIGGLALAATVKNAYQTIADTTMGYSDGTIRHATPSIRPYLPQQGQGGRGGGMGGDISAGATGDLVFAMHNNRNTGYL